MTYPGTLLKGNNLFARKELGQNFLADPNAAQMIVNRADIFRDDLVLEIGPGLGALTIPAAKKAKKVYAVEKDTRLSPLLREELASAGITNAEVITGDIMNIDIPLIAGREKLVVIGNLPYNISSQILFRLVENRSRVKKAVLMFQKELAQRITAPPGKKEYGRLSAVMQYSSTVTPLADLGPKLFFPKPDVESRVIEISFFDTTPLSPEKETFLYRVIKAAFSKRRKTLRNSLAGKELDITAEDAVLALEASGIDPARRAETLNVDDFTALSRELWKIGQRKKYG